mmetsp:Transcript_64374/g.172331  ORF Transcript_64374/g.172331 Transcript_64374/m.172331 type:complete len:706 (+) Transcript_64374:103-2220(+)
MSAVGVSWEGLGYFCDDMKRDIWFLLRYASTLEEATIVTGLEPENCGSAVWPLVEEMRDRAMSMRSTDIVVIPHPSPEERELLDKLQLLRFYCNARIIVFPCSDTDEHKTVWECLVKYVSSLWPQWALPVDDPRGGVSDRRVVPREVFIVGVQIESEESVLLHAVWCTEKRKHAWQFVGGEVRFGHDETVYDAARRVWAEKVGCVYGGLGWDDVFEVPAEKGILVHISDEDSSSLRHPSRPFLFVKVKQEFVAARTVGRRHIRMTMPEHGQFVKHNNTEAVRQVHSEGWTFIEHEEGSWLELDVTNGRMSSVDDRPIRKEHTELMRAKPDTLWQWLEGFGVKVVMGAAIPEGKQMLVVRNIDKAVSDEVLTEFFAERGVVVTSVFQLAVPKHCAKVEVEDPESMKKALRCNGMKCGRRNITVEILDSESVPLERVRGSDVQPAVAAEPVYSGLPPNVAAIAAEGPWFITVAGFDPLLRPPEIESKVFQLVESLAPEAKIKSHKTKITIDQGMVLVLELDSQEGCVQACKLHGEGDTNLAPAKLTVTLGEPKPPVRRNKDKEKETEAGERRERKKEGRERDRDRERPREERRKNREEGPPGAGGPKSNPFGAAKPTDTGHGKGKGKSGGYGKGADDGFHSADEEESDPFRRMASKAEGPGQRPRLNLKPRSKPLDADRSAPVSGTRPSPFGPAKPVSRADMDDKWR